MSRAVDLHNALTDPRADNFRCLLFRLMFKADAENMTKLAQVYPVEANMVRIYRSHHSGFPNFGDIETKALQYVKERT